jgi:pimeloyl-ACP methyl ester carboxylesterase
MDTIRRMASFKYAGERLAYTEYGPRDDAARARTTILVHGLLLSQRMHEPLARALAERGNRTVTVDLLGHGRSDRPRDMWRYTMPQFGEQIVALMDHLELEESVVLGTSLGANAALEVAAAAPERLRALVIEMPVLDNALVAAAIAFAPLLVGLTLGEPIARISARVARLVPRRGVPFWIDVALDTIRQDPGPSAAVLQGLFFGRTAPPRADRRKIATPALVIGHHRDPVHPFSDAGMLAAELVNGRLIEASSLLELRFTPERLTTEIANFIEDRWKPRQARGGRARNGSGTERAVGGRAGSRRAATG